MNPVAQVTKTVSGKQTINPKTVLGFYATVLGLLFAATVGVTGVLAVNNVLLDLIPGLLIFAGASLVAILVGVFVVSLRDPSKLMLTQVTGTEYAQIQQITLGDSSRGDRIEVLPAVEVIAIPSVAAVDDTDEGSSTEDVAVVADTEPLESGK